MPGFALARSCRVTALSRRDMAKARESAEHYKIPFAFDSAQSLRAKGMKVSVDVSGKKLGDQIGNADKRAIPQVIVIGDEETKTGLLKTKDLRTGEEKILLQ